MKQPQTNEVWTEGSRQPDVKPPPSASTQIPNPKPLEYEYPEPQNPDYFEMY